VLNGKKVTSLAAGAFHSLGLCSDGTLVAWGSNASGQLGDETVLDAAAPVAVDASGLLAGKTVVQIASGGSHNLVLCSDGTLAAWGLNDSGQLGIGTNVASNRPVAVDTSGVLAGRTVVSIRAGGDHSLILCADGTVAAFGKNDSGQLGDGTTTSRNLPVMVNTFGVLAGRTAVSLAAGASHTLAVCSDGTVAAWGNGTSGRLGNGATDPVNPLPIAVTSSGSLAGKIPIAVSAGGGHSLAIAASPLSNDSAIADLALSAGSLTQPFTPGTTSYTAVVAEGTESIAVIPTASDAYSTITVDGTIVASGFASGPIILSPGPNPVVIVVTAEDGSSSTYTVIVNVNRPPVFSSFTGSTAWQTAALVSCAKILAKASDADGDALSVTSAGQSSTGGGTAVLQGSTILYTPATGFSGTDTFPITITDARGSSMEGVVTMNVGQPPDGGGQGGNPPRLTMLPAGRIGIAFQGIPGRSYQIQRSTNLVDWTLIATVVAAGNGAVEFVDENPPEGSGFYRLRKP
jgi:hypothetical protein